LDVSSNSKVQQISQADEAFYKAMISREFDTWKLAHFFPAKTLVSGVLDVVGRAYGVTFRETSSNGILEKLITGWHKSVRIFEVWDGHPGVAAGGSKSPGRVSKRGLLGFVYLDIYVRRSIFGRPACQLAGAEMLCSGHAYLSLNLVAPPLGQNKLFNPEEVVAMAHELGHAVHMLCHSGDSQQFHDLPLDVLELPSTLAETLVLQPDVITQFAKHYDKGGLPPDDLVRSCQRGALFFERYLQNTNVTLGLHSEMFDPENATPEDLRKTAQMLWQQYSAVTVHPLFSPFGEDAGQYVPQGANQVAYLLCYLRVDGILNGPVSSASPGRAGHRTKDASQTWLSPAFSGRLRSQLLDKAFPGQRLAALMPPLADEMNQSTDVVAQEPPLHPLPPHPSTGAALFGRLPRLV